MFRVLTVWHRVLLCLFCYAYHVKIITVSPPIAVYSVCEFGAWNFLFLLLENILSVIKIPTSELANPTIKQFLQCWFWFNLQWDPAVVLLAMCKTNWQFPSENFRVLIWWSITFNYLGHYLVFDEWCYLKQVAIHHDIAVNYINGKKNMFIF